MATVPHCFDSVDAENILVFDPPTGSLPDPYQHPERLCFKISDFGCAALMQGFASSTVTIVGTDGPYMAPEMSRLLNGTDGRRSYAGAALDIWGLGMLWLHVR